MKNQQVIMENQHDNMISSFTELATNLINKKYEKKLKRDIWADSKWKNIRDLENDDEGAIGEEIIGSFCQKANIDSKIDGTKTKQVGGGTGDGTIKGKSCEVKTARLGSDRGSFQHELGEVPWKAEFMIFFDIAPKKMYVTIFPNFSEKFYKTKDPASSKNGSLPTRTLDKCAPYFPTKSVTQRKGIGSYKLDTTVKINESNKKKYTFIIDENTTDSSKFKTFVDAIIQ